MKISFLLGSPAISGGTYVIFEHATRIQKMGFEVFIITEDKVNIKDVEWHTHAKNLNFITFHESREMEFDIAIATWWRTAYELYRVKSKKYIYFVQSIESKFYPPTEKSIIWLAEATYMIPIDVITEATWISDYLKNKYNKNVSLVHNGIRKDIYNKNGDSYKKSKGLRVLVEGPIDVPFKNVPKTIELVKKSMADEIWLLTSSDVKDYPGVDRVFSRVPITEVAKIYRSCDVLVKLSYVEGMFGPPLEMFHCGGTAITYDVTGHDEYLVDNYNSFVVKTDDDENVINRINQLKSDSKLLIKLKKNAEKTAENWIDWQESSERFFKALNELYKIPSINQQSLDVHSKLIFDGYVNYETKKVSLKKCLRDLLHDNHPKLYIFYTKLKKFLKK
jgi:O-antigen biosynthesis protein